MKKEKKSPFKVGQIIQNLKTGAIYIIIADSGSCEQTSQKRLSEVPAREYKLYKYTKSRKMKDFYADFNRIIE